LPHFASPDDSIFKKKPAPDFPPLWRRRHQPDIAVEPQGSGMNRHVLHGVRHVGGREHPERPERRHQVFLIFVDRLGDPVDHLIGHGVEHRDAAAAIAEHDVLEPIVVVDVGNSTR
jgi:hypothetical protein